MTGPFILDDYFHGLSRNRKPKSVTVSNICFNSVFLAGGELVFFLRVFFGTSMDLGLGIWHLSAAR